MTPLHVHSISGVDVSLLQLRSLLASVLCLPDARPRLCLKTPYVPRTFVHTVSIASLLAVAPQRSPRASSVTAGGFGVSLKVGVNLAGVGVSVIDASPRELLYVTVEDITVDYLRGGQV